MKKLLLVTLFAILPSMAQASVCIVTGAADDDRNWANTHVSCDGVIQPDSTNLTDKTLAPTMALQHLITKGYKIVNQSAYGNGDNSWTLVK